MPTRTSSIVAGNKDQEPPTAQSRASDLSKSDDWDSGGTNTEKQSRQKLHVSPSTGSMNVSSKKSNTSAVADKSNNAASKSMVASRRRQSSIPNTKALSGPRALDLPAQKRSASNSINPHYNTVNGTSAVASQDPHTHQLSINDISRFSFASIGPSQKEVQHDAKKDPLDFADFLAPINFDDFHNSITTADPSLSHFPLPGGGIIGQKTSAEEQKNSTQSAVPIPTTRKVSNPASLGRKSSVTTTSVTNVNRTMPKTDSTAANSASILKGRRQSQFPPNAFNNTNSGKAPRKSIGPGTFVALEDSENTAPRRFPSLAGRKSSAESQKALSTRLASRGEDSAAAVTKTTTSPRASKAKSFLVPTRTSSKDLLTPSRTPDPLHPPSSGAARTPSRAPTGRSGTPGRTGTPGASSTGNRRMSVYATGLGARTISPTDARRMRRMSTMPPAPPLPQNRISQAPPTPLPEPLPLGPQSTAHSPAPGARKSVTPSSWRTTPDPNRKSYSSGQSLSSSTSYNSVRNSAALPIRLSQNLYTTRLTTPKPKLDTSMANDGEVPPVPAIPKAYESPQSELDQPFFSARSSSQPPVEHTISASPHMASPADALPLIETSRAPSVTSRDSSGPILETEQKRPQQPVANNKGLRPLRLPPLTLLPLSTPTATKIEALKDQQTTAEDRAGTPPYRRIVAKTPSTPMTASKASFFARSAGQGEEITKNIVRSSTSHLTRFDFEEQRTPDGNSPSLSFDFDDLTPQRNISPFVSTSLPKSSAEFPSYMRPQFTSDMQRNGNQARPVGPRAPSFSVTPKGTEKPSPIESESAFSMSAPRSKLNQSRYDQKAEAVISKEQDPAKYDNMPPPKLPASATWNGLANKAPSPTQRPSYLTSRRKTSNSSIGAGSQRQESFSSTQSVLIEGRPSIDSIRSIGMHSNRSASLLAATQVSAANKSTGHLPSHEASLDKDDLVAEEEMKKLASKRKDFESAARELDALRRRARPVPRSSPILAQQTFDLNLFERGEVVDYPDVYFTGTRIAQKIVGDPNQLASNFGYDDERGDYNIIEGDHLAYRYEVVDILGKGSFGQVVRCIDHKTGILVAVKIIRNKKRFHQQALVEVNILQKLRDWDPHNRHSCVNFEQSFYFRGHLCISTDLLGMNLYEFIKAHDFKGFSLKLIRRFTKQLLSSLVLLHGHKVIHCDLKPENVLLAHPMHSEIKVIDFGSSCFENEKVYTYIQSRFYRSPEVILGMSYGMPIDMWSLGCILAELYTGYPIFPGENEQEQLACIMEVFGPPEKHLIEKSSRKKLFFDSLGKPRLTVSSKGRRRRPSSKELRQVLKCDDEAFLDFITKCLRWDPARRMNPHEANLHEFITGVKMSATRRTLATATNSPVKRTGSVTTTPAGARPLPQPPATSLKNGIAVRQDVSMSSPNKAAPRRQSNMNSIQQSATAKRTSQAAAMSASNSSLTRASFGQNSRSMSTKSDLATAAAAASLVR